jgi:hypothetical protein
MKSKSILNTGFALLFFAAAATAGTVPLNTLSYNFALGANGGGASATLNGVPVEIYCDDFANDAWVPYSYTANVTVLGTGANLGSTRFGGVSSSAWTPLSLKDSNPTLNAQYDAFFNSGTGSTALARYEMAAYLVSLYNRSLGSNTSNNQIQEAIWSLMDPKAEGTPSNPLHVDTTSYLEQAANWYNSMNTTANLGALNAFLGKFEIVSPSNMTFSSGLGIGGFQEQIVMNTPEPRGVALLLGLMICGFLVMHRKRSKLAAVQSKSLNVVSLAAAGQGA